jgi:hypothetical protein
VRRPGGGIPSRSVEPGGMTNGMTGVLVVASEGRSLVDPRRLGAGWSCGVRITSFVTVSGRE